MRWLKASLLLIVMVILILVSVGSVALARYNARLGACNIASIWQTTHAHLSDRALEELHFSSDTLRNRQKSSLDVVIDMIEWQESVSLPAFATDLEQATLNFNQNWANSLSVALGRQPLFDIGKSRDQIYADYDAAYERVSDRCDWAEIEIPQT